MERNYNVSLNDANRNFSKVMDLVDENGVAVILKNDKPRYFVIDADEYSNFFSAMRERSNKIESLSDLLIEENIEALTELAK